MGMSLKQIFFPTILTVLVLLTIAIQITEKPIIKNSQSPSDVVLSPQPVSQTAPYTDHEGVYKNSRYGFRFSYSNDIFAVAGVSSENSIERTSIDHSLILEAHVYTIAEENRTFPGYQPTLYFATLGKADGDPISQYDFKNKKFVVVGTKISSISSDGTNGVLYEATEKFEDYRLGLYYYSADFIKGNKIYVLRVLGSTKNVQGYRKDFEKMIESLKFY
jgi:hypothetical protein